MPHFQFPSHYVFWTKVENHEEIKSQYLSKIKSIDKNISNTHNFICNVRSNIRERVDFFEDDIDTVNSIVWKPVQEMIEESNNELVLGESIIQSYWYNIYETGDFQEKHTHHAYPIEMNGKVFHPSLSVIYILNDNNTNGSTMFTDTHSKPFGPMLSYVSLDTCNIEEIGEGSVIIFSSKLDHMVKPVKIGGRITIAFNIFSTFSRTEGKP